MSTHCDQPSAADRTRLAGWIALAARGWHLFPVRPAGKAPAIAGWQERATTDPDRLARFFTDHPHHNAGIACGPSGLLVIDCDVPKGLDPDDRDGADVLADLADRRGGLPPTWTVTTPSGGRHLYFQAPAGGPVLGNTSGTLGRMLDTRGVGGQVLAPGSRLPAGGYELLDDTDPAPLPGWLAWRPSPRAPTTVSGPPVFTAARALGQLVGAGALDRAAVEHDLTAAAGHIAAGPCDCTARDIAASIRSGLDHGERRPRRLPAPTTGRRTA